jgi:hypothetical protein
MLICYGYSSPLLRFRSPLRESAIRTLRTRLDGIDPELPAR